MLSWTLWKGVGDRLGGRYLVLVNTGLLWNGEARPRVQGRLPGGGDARARDGWGSQCGGECREKGVPVPGWGGVGEGCEEG